MERDLGVAKGGKASFRVNFLDNENIAFQNLSQWAVVTSGRYAFAAWLKTEVITTDEGVRFCVADPDAPANLSAQSESTRGTTGWTEVRMQVTVPPATQLVKISLCRQPSLKFDSKISGKAWVDGVSLSRMR